MPREDSAEEEDASPDENTEEEEPSESSQIWEHVKALRRRVAGFN
jgi:hypothetical protein